MTPRQAAHAAVDALLDVVGDHRGRELATRLCTIASQRDQETRDREALEELDAKIIRGMAAITEQWEELRFVIESAPGMMPCDADGA